MQMESSDFAPAMLIRDIMAEERAKMPDTKVFPVRLAEAVYRRLDERQLSPLLVQFAALSDLRKRARDFMVEQARKAELELEMEQEDVQDLNQYRLLFNYPGERCLDCGEVEADPKHSDGHEYNGMYCSIPIRECTASELEANAERLLREGRERHSHTPAQASDGIKIMRARHRGRVDIRSQRMLRYGEPGRGPKLSALRKIKSGRHHPYDGVGFVIQAYFFPKNVRTRAKA